MTRQITFRYVEWIERGYPDQRILSFYSAWPGLKKEESRLDPRHEERLARGPVSRRARQPSLSRYVVGTAQLTIEEFAGLAGLWLADKALPSTGNSALPSMTDQRAEDDSPFGRRQGFGRRIDPNWQNLMKPIAPAWQNPMKPTDRNDPPKRKKKLILTCYAYDDAENYVGKSVEYEGSTQRVKVPDIESELKGLIARAVSGGISEPTVDVEAMLGD